MRRLTRKNYNATKTQVPLVCHPLVYVDTKGRNEKNHKNSSKFWVYSALFIGILLPRGANEVVGQMENGSIPFFYFSGFFYFQFAYLISTSK